MSDLREGLAKAREEHYKKFRSLREDILRLIEKRGETSSFYRGIAYGSLTGVLGNIFSSYLVELTRSSLGEAQWRVFISVALVIPP